MDNNEGDMATDDENGDVSFLPKTPKNADNECAGTSRDFVGKIVYSASLCGAFLVFGWSYEQIGPALLDLQYNTGVSFTHASVYMTAINITHILGSVVSSLLYGRVHTSIILGVSLVGVAVAVSIIPWCTAFPSMLAAHGIQGVFGGSVDSVALAEILALWGSDSESPVQALYFSFAFGAILAPLLVTPFLMNMEETDRKEDNFGRLRNHSGSHQVLSNGITFDTESYGESMVNTTDKPYLFTDLPHNTTVQPHYINCTCMNLSSSDYFVDTLVTRQSSDLYIPYSISAGLCLTAAIPFFILLILSLLKKFKVKHVDDDIRVTKSLSTKLKLWTLLVTGIISGIDTSMEDAYGDFLTAFCVSHMGWTKQNGAYATSLFSGSFAAGRFAGIFLASCFKPLHLVITYSTMICFVNVAFILSGMYGFGEGIWLCSALSGIGMSIISPSIFTLTEESFFPVTGKIASYYVITACLGSAGNSFLIGYLMDNISRMYMLYVLCAEGFLILIMAAICKMLLCSCYKKEEEESPNYNSVAEAIL